MQKTQTGINETQKIILVIGAGVLISVVGIVGYTSGFFDGLIKPAKPDIIPVNPTIKVEFDAFYDKYPNISQEDVNQLHSRVLTIMTQDSEPETVMGQMMLNAFMKGLTTGMVENYLDSLDIKYYTADKGAVPELI